MRIDPMQALAFKNARDAHCQKSDTAFLLPVGASFYANLVNPSHNEGKVAST